VSLRRIATAVLAAATVTLLGGCAEEVEPATCGVVVDASGSTQLLMQKVRPAVEKFVAGARCGTVRVVMISLNSIGETCTAPTLDLATAMRADRGNQGAWDVEYRDEQVPRIGAVAERLVRCVYERGTHVGTDVYGALVELARTLPAPGTPVRVFIASDMVNTVDTDLRNESLATAEDREKVLRAAAGRGRLPDMSGWVVDATGAAYGTSALGPAFSAHLQQYWSEAFTSRHATYRQLAS
jgi:hypothetical protein